MMKKPKSHLFILLVIGFLVLSRSIVTGASAVGLLDEADEIIIASNNRTDNPSIIPPERKPRWWDKLKKKSQKETNDTENRQEEIKKHTIFASSTDNTDNKKSKNKKGRQKKLQRDAQTTKKKKHTIIRNCHSHVHSQGVRHKLKRLWYRRHRKPKLAYRMAILATMSYWEFHKWALPGNVTGFRLQNDPSPTSSLFLGIQNKMPVREHVFPWNTRNHSTITQTALVRQMRQKTCRLWQRITATTTPHTSSLWDTMKRNVNYLLSSTTIFHHFENEARSKSVTEWLPPATRTIATTTTTKSRSCDFSSDPREPPPPQQRRRRRQNNNKHNLGVDRHRVSFQYWLYNWYESGVAGVMFHDTDVLISASEDGKLLVIAFGGTASGADAITNIQTFEPANHSGFFHGGGTNNHAKNANPNASVQGSLHRGFLNAYSRVDRGSALRLCPSSVNGNCTASSSVDLLLQSLHQRFGHCTSDASKKAKKEKKKAQNVKNTTDSSRDNIEMSDGQSSNGNALTTTSTMTNNSNTLMEEDDNDNHTENDRTGEKPENVKERRKSGGCKAKGEKLVDILRELVTSALQRGITVHVSGHSLGGALSSMLALDVIVNFPAIPVSRLHLWTFGAPQIGDDVFLNSAMECAPRLQGFVREQGNGRFHRFVTLSDECKVDAVSEVAKRTLASHKPNFRGRAARKLGGVHGHIMHLAEPHYLLTPNQYDAGDDISDSVKEATTTRSSVAAHAAVNYLQGISRESREYPLRSDLPHKVAEWLGEV